MVSVRYAYNSVSVIVTSFLLFMVTLEGKWYSSINNSNRLEMYER